MAIPETEERLVLATGRFIGEGFDDARLDTLFLASPVSWRGTLVPYAGHLHRKHHAKTEVRVMDYVDHNAPVLAKMFKKRMRGYRAMGYSKHAGGLDNVATVLVDLAEILDAGRLVDEAARSPLAWSQRLGFLLELAEADTIAEVLLPFVEQHATRVTPLDASLPRTGRKRSPRWRVAINTDVEVDV